MLANEQMRLVRPDGRIFGYVTLHTRIALTNYSGFNRLLPTDIVVQEINYKVNLSNTIIGIRVVVLFVTTISIEVLTYLFRLKAKSKPH